MGYTGTWVTEAEPLNWCFKIDVQLNIIREKKLFRELSNSGDIKNHTFLFKNMPTQ